MISPILFVLLDFLDIESDDAAHIVECIARGVAYSNTNCKISFPYFRRLFGRNRNILIGNITIGRKQGLKCKKQLVADGKQVGNRNRVEKRDL